MNILVTVKQQNYVLALQYQGCTMVQKLITNGRQLAHVRTTMTTERAYSCFMILHLGRNLTTLAVRRIT